MFQPITARLTKRTDLTYDVSQFHFKCINPLELDFSAGQYMLIHVPLTHGHIRRKHYSIVSSEKEKEIFELLVQLFKGGVGSEYLRKLKIGDEVSMQGAAGVFTYKNSPRDKVFIATGTGIAPIKSILTTVLNPKKQDTRNIQIQNSQFNVQNSKFYLFWGLKTAKDVYFLDDFKRLAKENPNFTFQIFLSRQQRLKEDEVFRSGRVAAGLKELIQNSEFSVQNSDFYIAGYRDTVEALRQWVIAHGAKPERITFEKFV
ncbi:FAD-dependent oxidoreductase [Candidatus Roizmanbacteria bacterium]|nr:FAD-dependent oxidoreductase [Candidatus Roizmanbacteria bacterium]